MDYGRGEFRGNVGRVVDIFAGGVCIGVDAMEGIDVGSCLGFSFTLPNGIGVNGVTAVVRNISEEGRKHLLGMRFVDYVPEVTGFCCECAESLE